MRSVQYVIEVQTSVQPAGRGVLGCCRPVKQYRAHNEGASRSLYAG